MLKTSSNGTQAQASNGALKFALRPTAETLADLSRPIDPRHLKTRKQGNTTLTYCPWNTIARHLHHRAPGWCWEVQSVQEVGGSMTKMPMLVYSYVERNIPVNRLLEARFQELQELQRQRSDLNEKLGVKIAAYGGGGVALAAGLVALTGGLGLLLPAAIAGAQLAKGGYHGVRAGVQSHQQKVRELDQLIREKTQLIVSDLSQQLSSGTVSRDDGVAAYYRLKYMDSGMDRELDELARKLGV